MFNNDPFLRGIDVTGDLFTNEIYERSSEHLLDISSTELGLALALADELTNDGFVTEVVDTEVDEEEVECKPKHGSTKYMERGTIDEYEDPEDMYIRKYGDHFDV